MLKGIISIGAACESSNAKPKWADGQRFTGIGEATWCSLQAASDTQFCICYSETDRVGDENGNVHHILHLLDALSPDPEAIIAQVREGFG